MILQTIAAFFATISFAILFQVPKEQYLYSGITGAAGWLCYLVVFQLTPSVVLASFTAAMMLTLMARGFAVRRKTPMTIFLICGIFPLVPGAGIYYTAYYFIMDQYSMAMDKGIETIKIAVAIALGIVVIFSLPYSVFRWLNKP